MPKFNGLLMGLLVMAIVILLGLSVYEMFLKPRDEIPTSRIDPVQNYLGEDVLTFIQN